jgi:hypothetical protein
MSIMRAMLVLGGVCLVACGGAQTPQPAVSSSNTPAGTTASAVSPAPPPTESSDPNVMPAGLPPLPTVPFPAALPMPVVRTVFAFAADHPEVLSRIPCFCGCENRGHRHNDDCFVAGRDAAGKVTAWEPHGLG